MNDMAHIRYESCLQIFVLTFNNYKSIKCFAECLKNFINNQYSLQQS